MKKYKRNLCRVIFLILVVNIIRGGLSNNIAVVYAEEQSLSKPTNIQTEKSEGEVVLTWDRVDGATGYNIKRSENIDGEYKVISSNIPEATFTDTTVEVGKEYYYVIVAVAGDIESEESAKVKDEGTKYLIVEIYDHYGGTQSYINEIEVYDNEERKINYNITEVFDSAKNGAPQYWASKKNLNDGNYNSYASVNYSSSSGSGTWTRMVLDLQNNNGISKVDVWTNDKYKPQQVNIYESKSYDFNTNIKNRNNKDIKIFGEAFIKNTSNAEKYSITKSYLKAPTSLEGIGQNAQVELTWKQVDEAIGYNVKRAKTENGPYTTIANNVTEKRYIDQTAVNGLTYYYVVTAVNSEGESSKSNEVKVTVSATEYLVVEVYDHYESKQSYINEIEVYDFDGKKINYDVTEVFDSAKNGTPEYWASKKHLNDGNHGTYASVNYSSIPGSGTWTRMVLDLQQNKGVSKVDVWIDDECKPKQVNIYEATSYDFNTNIKNRNNVGIKIFGEAFIKDTNSIEKYSITKSYLKAPTNLKAIGQNARVELTWEQVDGAAGYNIKRSNTENGPYAIIANNVTGERYIDQTAVNGLTYYYVVTAVNSEGESSKSNEVKVRVSATKYLIVEVYDHYYNRSDQSHISEIEIYDVEGRKINYNVTEVFDSAKNGLPEFWASKKQLNDGNYNSFTSVNYPSIAGSGTWTRMVLDLQDNKGVSKVDVWTDDECKPEQVNIYEATSYDFNTNVKNRNNAGIKIFGEAFIKNTMNAEKYSITKSYLKAPTRLEAMGQNAQVELTWEQVDEAEGYNIKRSKVENGPYVTIANNVTGKRYVDQTAINGVTYYYVVTAMNSIGESSKSNEVKVGVSAINHLVVEIYDHHKSDQSFINEIEVYDVEGKKINYDVTQVFDSAKNGTPQFWDSHKCLNDGNYKSATSVNYPSSSGSGTWTRIVLDLQDNNGVSKVDVWTHSTNKPKQVNIYEAINYDYNVNIRERNNKGITYFGSTDINNNSIVEKYSVLPQLPYPPSRINYEEKDGQISIVWDSIPNASSYKVKRATTSGGPYTTIVENLKQTGFVDNTVVNNTQYFYVITSVNGAGESNNSDEISATPHVIIPIAPTNLEGTPSDAKVNLSWNLVNNADTYILKRSQTSGGPYTTVAEDITATSYEDTGLVNGNTYYYVISAKNEAGESSHSSEISVRAGAIILNPPTNVKGVPGDQKVILSWNTSNHATGYKVKRAATPGGPYVDIAGNIINNSFVDTNLINNTTYYYIIVAINDTEQSGSSAEVSATPGVFIPEQVLNFVGVADDNQVALSWDVNDKADTYTLKRALTPTGPFTIIAQGLTGTSYIDTSAVNNTSYYYIVSGVNKAGESPNSVVVLVIPKAKAGKRVILALTMTNGMQKDYDLSQTQLVEFLNWYRKAGKGQGMPYFTIIKGEDKGPYLSKRDYIIFEKILYFEINEFTK